MKRYLLLAMLLILSAVVGRSIAQSYIAQRLVDTVPRFTSAFQSAGVKIFDLSPGTFSLAIPSSVSIQNAQARFRFAGPDDNVRTAGFIAVVPSVELRAQDSTHQHLVFEARRVTIRPQIPHPDGLAGVQASGVSWEINYVRLPITMDCSHPRATVSAMLEKIGPLLSGGSTELAVEVSGSALLPFGDSWVRIPFASVEEGGQRRVKFDAAKIAEQSEKAGRALTEVEQSWVSNHPLFGGLYLDVLNGAEQEVTEWMKIDGSLPQDNLRMLARLRGLYVVLGEKHTDELLAEILAAQKLSADERKVQEVIIALAKSTAAESLSDADLLVKLKKSGSLLRRPTGAKWSLS